MTAPSFVVGLTNISATTPVVTTAHLAAGGINRRVCITILMRQGGGNTKLPTTLSIGGRTATYLAGEDLNTSRERVVTGTWAIAEADIALLTLNGGGTGYDVTMSGQTGSIRTVLLHIVQDTDQFAIGDTESLFTTSGTGSLPLIRAAESFTFFAVYKDTIGVVTLSNPAMSATLTDSGNATQIMLGYETDTDRTASATYANATRISSHVINFLPVPAQSITDVNNDDPVIAGESFPFTVSGYTGNVTSGNIASKALTSVTETGGSGSAVAPSPVDGQTFYKVTASSTVNQTITLTSSGSSANRSIPVLPSLGYTAVDLVDPNTTDPTYPGYWFTVVPVTADQLWYVTADLVSVDPDTRVTATNPVQTIMWHWVQATGVIYYYDVTINDAGEVVSAKGLTVKNLTDKGLTVLGLTSRGL